MSIDHDQPQFLMDESLNIVLLSTALGMGGTGQQVVRLSRSFDSRGHDVSFVSLISPGQLGRELASEGIPVHDLGMKRGVPDPRGLVRLVRFLTSKKPDILSSFLVHANIFARIAGNLAGVPIVTAIRNDNYCEGIECFAHRVTNFLDDAWMTNSHIVAKRMVERGLAPEKKRNVIHNCIDLEEYCPDGDARSRLRGELGIGDDTFLWVAVGRIETQKDYATLLRALSEIPREYDLQVAVAGKGSRFDHVSSLRAELGLEDRISFLGVRRDIPDLLAASDGFVLSSVSEGFPNVVMEALASETPVVATEVGGVPELVQNGETGFLVSPQNPSNLAQAMARLMNAPRERRKKMGEDGRKWIAKKCSVDEVVNQWIRLYRDAISSS